MCSVDALVDDTDGESTKAPHHECVARVTVIVLSHECHCGADVSVKGDKKVDSTDSITDESRWDTCRVAVCT